MKWIRCKAQLPPLDNKLVLTCDAKKNIWYGYYHSSSKPEDMLFLFNDDNFGLYEATHWMPLPEPPKENE